MKTYKVLESHLYERLMCILRGEQASDREHLIVVPQAESNPTETGVVPLELEQSVVSVPEEKQAVPAEYSSYQIGYGIKRAPQENWLSFHQFTRKRQQRAIKKRKCRKKRC